MLKLFHFSVFEEVLAESVDSECGTMYKLENPVKVIVHHSEEGTGVGFEDYVPFMKPKDISNVKIIYIPKDKAMFCIDEKDIQDNLKNEYNKIFNDGVIWVK